LSKVDFVEMNNTAIIAEFDKALKDVSDPIAETFSASSSTQFYEPREPAPKVCCRKNVLKLFSISLLQNHGTTERYNACFKFYYYPILFKM